MAKDPAFLFYSKDWLEGTAEMTPEEKGVYIDLLAHQHQKGSLPSETKRLAKLVGLSESDFEKIWSDIGSKFIANTTGRLVNRKLNGIVSERLEKGWRNTIVGTLGAIVRYAVQKEGKDPIIAEKAKKSFKVDDFLACADEKLSEAISVWFSERYKKCYESIANANNTNSKEVESGDRKEVPEEGKRGWNQMPGEKELGLSIPDIKAGSAKELMHLAGNKATTEQVLQLWGVFKVQHFTGKKYYQDEDEAYSHFINWSKTQKVNGAHQQQSVKRDKSSGARQVIKLLQDDIATDGIREENS